MQAALVGRPSKVGCYLTLRWHIHPDECHISCGLKLQTQAITRSATGLQHHFQRDIETGKGRRDGFQVQVQSAQRAMGDVHGHDGRAGQ